MEGLSRWVNLSFVFAGLLFWWVLGHLSETLFALFKVVNKPVLGENLNLASMTGLVLAAVVTLGLRFWKNQSIYSWGLNIAQELKKVTWPDWQDTQYATRVVVITTVIISGILAVFDFAFQHLTAMILGIEG